MGAKLYSYEFDGKSAQLWAGNHRDAVEKFRKAFNNVFGNRVKRTTSEEIAEKIAQDIFDRLNPDNDDPYGA